MGKLLVAAGTKCYINGRDTGLVTGMNYQSNTPHRPKRGLDSAVPFELAPGVAEVMGTISLLKAKNDGGLETGLGVVPSFKYLIREKYFTLMLVERDTDKIVFRADYCVVQNQAWNVQAKQLVTGQFTFSGITWANEHTQT